MTARSKFRKIMRGFSSRSDETISRYSADSYSQIAGIVNHIVLTLVAESLRLYYIYIIKGLVISIFPWLALFAVFHWLSGKSVALFVLANGVIIIMISGVLLTVFARIARVEEPERTQHVAVGSGDLSPWDLFISPKEFLANFGRRVKRFFDGFFSIDSIKNYFFGFVWQFSGLLVFLAYFFYDDSFFFRQMDSEVLSIMKRLFLWAVVAPIMGSVNFVLDAASIVIPLEWHGFDVLGWKPFVSDQVYILPKGQTP